LQWVGDSSSVQWRRIDGDVLDCFLSQPVEDIPDQEYLHLWKSHEAQITNLSAMAFEAAAIAAKSAKAEQVFSRKVRLHWT
jgi:hypothetical protein